MQSSDNAPMTQTTYVARVQCLQRSKMTEMSKNRQLCAPNLFHQFLRTPRNPQIIPSGWGGGLKYVRGGNNNNYLLLYTLS